MKSLCRLFTAAVISIFFVFSALASPRVLILSGGGSPVHNNYSQYLQTKTLTDFARKKFGKKNVDVLFGVGNATGKKGKVLPDVNAKFTDKKTEKQNTATIYGAIKSNRSGSKKNVVSYFKNELPKKLKADDTFFLFVSDHGFPNPESDGYDNNCIHMWSYDPDTFEDAPLGEQCLSKNELKEFIANAAPTQRTVFAMSQCYSGGFHQMSVDDTGKYPSANPDVCGFTSVPEDLMASGCTDDVEADRYQGYERYFTEEFSGRDIVSRKRLRSGHGRTVEESHERAVLRDATVDVPMSTSDYYLQSWYFALWADGFRPRAGKLRTAFLREAADEIGDGAWDEDKIAGQAGALGTIVRERMRILKNRVASLAKFHPELRPLFENGNANDLDKKSLALEKRLDAIDEEYGVLVEKYWSLRHRALFKPWFTAVKAGSVSSLNKEQKGDEAAFFGEMERQFGGDVQTDLGIRQRALMEISNLTIKDPARAKRFANYLDTRDAKMFAWAKASGDAKLTAVAAELEGLQSRMDASDAPSEDLSRQISHVRRVLEARQQLAAAVAIGMMGDEKAISELKALEICEKTGF